MMKHVIEDEIYPSQAYVGYDKDREDASISITVSVVQTVLWNDDQGERKHLRCLSERNGAIIHKHAWRFFRLPDCVYAAVFLAVLRVVVICFQWFYYAIETHFGGKGIKSCLSDFNTENKPCKNRLFSIAYYATIQGGFKAITISYHTSSLISSSRHKRCLLYTSDAADD